MILIIRKDKLDTYFMTYKNVTTKWVQTRAADGQTAIAKTNLIINRNLKDSGND